MRTLCVVVALLLLPVTHVARACSDGRRQSVEELYAGASVVFLGRLVRVEEEGSPVSAESVSSKPSLVATFQIVEVFKGEPPASGVLRVPAPESCDTLLLLVAFDHVLFLSDQRSIRTPHEAMLLYDPPNDDIVGERKRLLDKLRSLSEQQPK